MTFPSAASPVDIELHALHCELARFETLLDDVAEHLAPVKNGERLSVEVALETDAPGIVLSPLDDTLRTFTRRIERARRILATLQMSLEE